MKSFNQMLMLITFGMLCCSMASGLVAHAEGLTDMPDPSSSNGAGKVIFGSPDGAITITSHPGSGGAGGSAAGTGGSTGVAGSLSGSFVPLVPDLPGARNNSIPELLNTLFLATIAIAAVLAVIMVVVGGFEYMTTESPFTIGDAKSRIFSALFGLLIVLTAVLVLRTINPALINLDRFTPAGWTRGVTAQPNITPGAGGSGAMGGSGAGGTGPATNFGSAPAGSSGGYYGAFGEAPATAGYNNDAQTGNLPTSSDTAPGTSSYDPLPGQDNDAQQGNLPMGSDTSPGRDAPASSPYNSDGSDFWVNG